MQFRGGHTADGSSTTAMGDDEDEGVDERRSYIVGGKPGDKYRFTVLANGVVRYEWAPDGVFEDRPSLFAAARHVGGTFVGDVRVRDSVDCLEIITSRFQLTYNKEEFSPHGLYALVFNYTRYIWRYGEDKPEDNLGGTIRTLDDVDGEPADRGMGVCSRKGFASIDDSDSLLIDANGFVTPRRPGPGRVDGYLFAYGHEYSEAVQALYHVSGSPPILPRWALGNWWSRYYPYSDQSFLSLMDDFASHAVPLSVAVLDMDWHLVDDPRVKEAGQTGWTGYTWNRDLFPDPPAFLEELHRRGLKVTLNDHPADGVHSYEDQYEAVARAMGIDPSADPDEHQPPIPFDLTNRAFLVAYYKVLLKAREDDGVDFWWIDWQQGVYSRIKGADPLWLCNYYGFRHNFDATRPPTTNTTGKSRNRAGRERGGDRPLILSRYAGPGSHRTPIGFSGDAIVSWGSLAAQPAFTARAANIGYGWWSHDIGGHLWGGRDDELTARWVQLGCFSPILRLHSADTPWVVKEPWRLRGGGPREAATAFLRMRHRLLPYLHTCNVLASGLGSEAGSGSGSGSGMGSGWSETTSSSSKAKHGSSGSGSKCSVPIVRPLYWDYPESEEAYKYENQFFFGSKLMVIPITSPKDPRIGLARTKGWLPPGDWVDFFDGQMYTGGTGTGTGGREVSISRNIEQYPVFMAPGAIVVLDTSPDVDRRNSTPRPEALEIVVAVGGDGEFGLWEDESSLPVKKRLADGQSQEDGEEEGLQERDLRDVVKTCTIRFNQAEGGLSVVVPPRFAKQTMRWTVTFRGFRAAKINDPVSAAPDGSSGHDDDDDSTEVVGVGGDNDATTTSTRVEAEAQAESDSETAPEAISILDDVGLALPYTVLLNDVTCLSVELDGPVMGGFSMCIGAEPQIALRNPVTGVKRVLEGAEVEYTVKEKVWEAVTGQMGRGKQGDEGGGLTTLQKMRRLEGVEMGEALRAAVTEVLLADERLYDGV